MHTPISSRCSESDRTEIKRLLVKQNKELKQELEAIKSFVKEKEDFYYCRLYKIKKLNDFCKCNRGKEIETQMFMRAVDFQTVREFIEVFEETYNL